MKRVLIATGVVAVAGGVGTALFMSSCDPDCEVEAKPSVIVQIESDSKVSGAVERVTVDSVAYEFTDESGTKSPTKRAECMDDECTEWMLGEGLPGTYEIHATYCGKQVDSRVTVSLGEDGCQVDTQLVDLEVDSSACATVEKPEPPDRPVDVPTRPVACSLEARPSVVAHVLASVDDRLVPVGAERVFYQWEGEPNGRELEGLCLSEDCSQFAAGFEQVGTFTVGAEVCGETIRGQATIEKTQDGCHVQTQTVKLVAEDISKCDVPPKATLEPDDPKCTREARPSALVFPVKDGKDVWLPVPTEQLWYEHDDTREKGYCAQPAEGGLCTMWVAGWDQTGRFKVYTEKCGIDSGVVYSVESTEDGCHAHTEYVPIFVDERGCIRAPGPSEVEPPSTPPSVDSVTR